MKKLLAMILCVMMLASLSVSAFAEVPVADEANKVVLAGAENEDGETTYSITRGWAGTAITKKIVKDTTEAIEKMYQSIAVDNALFNTLTGVDDMLGNIAKNMYANIDGTLTIGTLTVTQKQLEDATKSYLRSAVGGEVNDYMAKHSASFTNSSGRITKPVEYMNAYATALSKALSSEKAAKGLEALMTEIMAVNVWKEMGDKMDDLRDEAREWDSDVDGIFFNNVEDWALNYGILNAQNNRVLFNADVQSTHMGTDDDGNTVRLPGYADADGNTYTWTNADDEEVTLGVGVLDYIQNFYNNTGLTQVPAEE